MESTESKYSRSQRGLLELCRRNPGPSLREMHHFAPIYGVSPETVRGDLIALLDERLLAPLGTIDPTTYLPMFCVITEQGEAVAKEGPPVEEDRGAFRQSIVSRKQDIKMVTRNWPTLSSMSTNEVLTIAEAYLFWAEQEHPAMESLGLDRESLLRAAARGFGHVQDPRRFAKAVKKALAAKAREGTPGQLAMMVDDLLEDHPDYAAITMGAASVVLAEPYRRLTGRPLPPLTIPGDLERVLQELFQTASRIGQHYLLHLADGNVVVTIMNRTEDILAEAFRTANQPLYAYMVHLLEMQVEMMGCLVTPTGEAEEFEERAGFRSKVDLANRAAEFLEHFSNLVRLPEPKRTAACDVSIEIVRLIGRLFVPLKRVGQFEPAEPGMWVLDLVGTDELAIHSDLIRRFEQLVEICPEDDDQLQPAAVPPLHDAADMMKVEMDGLREMLRTIAGDTAVIRYVLLPAVQKHLGDLVNVARYNNEALQEVCRLILNSDLLLQRIDTELAADLPALRADIERWLKQAPIAPALPEAERETIVKALGQMVKLSNAGKLLCSIPLIPGFLQYRWELGVGVDLNRWFERVVALFRRGGE